MLLRGLQPPSEAILPGQWTRPDGALLQPEVPATTAVLGRTAGCPVPVHVLSLVNNRAQRGGAAVHAVCVVSRSCAADASLYSAAAAHAVNNAESHAIDTLPEWSKGVDSSSTSASCVGSNPTSVTLLLWGLQPPSGAVLPDQRTRPDGHSSSRGCPPLQPCWANCKLAPRPCSCAEPCQESVAAWRCCCACRVRCFPKLCSGRVVLLCCGCAWRQQRRKSCHPTLCPSGLRGWTQVPLA